MKRWKMMDTDCENSINVNSPDTLIEAKLAKVPKAFSIENLIAKKPNVEVENEQSDHPLLDSSAEHFTQHKIPPIAFPQNFPFIIRGRLIT